VRSRLHGGWPEVRVDGKHGADVLNETVEVGAEERGVGGVCEELGQLLVGEGLQKVYAWLESLRVDVVGCAVGDKEHAGELRRVLHHMLWHHTEHRNLRS